MEGQKHRVGKGKEREYRFRVAVGFVSPSLSEVNWSIKQFEHLTDRIKERGLTLNYETSVGYAPQVQENLEEEIEPKDPVEIETPKPAKEKAAKLVKRRVTNKKRGRPKRTIKID